MFYKIKKFLKIALFFKPIITIIFFFLILLIIIEPAFSTVTKIERNLAFKYCDSVEKNLFKGLDNEILLKYEYFFDSIDIQEIDKEEEYIKKFVSEVETICSNKLKKEEINDFRILLRKHLLNN